MMSVCILDSYHVCCANFPLKVVISKSWKCCNIGIAENGNTSELYKEGTLCRSALVRDYKT